MLKSIFLRSVLVSLAGLALAAPALAAVVPSLVADIDPGFHSEGSHPDDFVSLNGRVLFTAGEERALWSTAGVPGDPVRLGPAHMQEVSPPVVLGSRAYVVGCLGSFSCALWVTDGTPAGTRQLTDLRTADGGLYAVAPAGLPHALVIFPARDPFLWRTNGNPGGTRRVGLGASRPRDLVSFQGKGWFFADLPNAGGDGALFSSNGLPGGTRRIGASRDGERLTVVGNRLVYFAGTELWSSDGTSAGTRKLAEILSGIELPNLLVAAGRAFLFDFDFAAGRRELLVTDGTPAGTRRIAVPFAFEQEGLIALGGKVAFLAGDATGGTELWSSDGTVAGTRRVKDVCPGVCSGAVELGVATLGRIWFRGFTPSRGAELWSSDLTPAGTRLSRETCPGSCDGRPSGWLALGSRLYFNAVGPGGLASLWVSDGTTARPLPAAIFGLGARLTGTSIVFSGSDEEHGAEPWVTNGTAAGTGPLADLTSDNLASSDPRVLMPAGGRAFFYADDGIAGRELWVSDGTEEGTRLAYEFEPGPGGSSSEFPSSSEAAGRLVLFSDSNFDLGSSLFGSDGTPAGSGVLLPESVRVDRRRQRAGDQLFFFGSESDRGEELWVTDGTPSGTARLTDLVPPEPFRPDDGSPPVFQVLLALGDRAVVPALSATGGEELWISDGTPGGTQLLHQVYPFLEEPLGRALTQPFPFGGHWYFVVAETDRAALWRTDLTAAGTGVVGPLDLGDPTASGWRTFLLEGRLLVFGPSAVLGSAFWTSDGTSDGTRIVGPARGMTASVEPAVFGGRLWYRADFSELWTTDGTAAGTQAFRLEPHVRIDPRAFQVVGDRLVILTDEKRFLATDGTVAGTTQVELPGRSPSEFYALGVEGRMFFSWDDLEHGTELWVLRPE